ncbi:MAG: hypothetical protein DME65_02530 [Verrucomicrobia bacterium]|nr:MAG: hypothetical protein DME65_02530 [Verrucomicrobiota bacterium]
MESIQAAEKETANRQEYQKHAARYFRLALRYAIAGSEPLVLIVMGRVGTGKSTIAKRLAGELRWPAFSSDEIRKRLACLPLTQRTPLELREKIYSERVTQQTYTKLLEEGLAAVKNNPGVIVDATFSTGALRKFLHDGCKKANAPYQFVELEIDSAEIKKRLKARNENTAEASDARVEDFQKLTAAYEPPSELGPHLIRVSTTTSAADAVKTILLRLAERQVVGTDFRPVR